MTEEAWKQPNKPWWRIHQTVLFLMVFGVILLGSSVLALRNDSAKDPYASTAVEISKLIPLVKDLQETPDTRDVSKSTYTYLHTLSLIEKRCQKIQEYSQTMANLSLDMTRRSIVNQSRDLCADLTKLTDYSLSIYTPAKTLLSARTTPRRYETFKPLSTQIKQRHLEATQNALNELKQASSNDIDFPSSSRRELEQLQKDIRRSEGLVYLPSLHQFQLSLLAERQRFWGPYANTTQLTKSLESQLATYCQTLADSKPRPTECEQ